MTVTDPRDPEARPRRRRSPHEIKRYTTDSWFLLPFTGVLLIWIFGTITVISMGATEYENRTKSFFWGNITEYIMEHNIQQYEWINTKFYIFFSYNFSLLCTLTGIIILMVCVRFVLRLFRCQPETWTKFGMLYLSLHLILSLVLVFRIFFNFPERGAYDYLISDQYKLAEYRNYFENWTAERENNAEIVSIDVIEIIVRSCFGIFYCIVTIRCFGTVMLGDIADILQNVIRIFYFNFRLVYFGVAVFAWQLFVMNTCAKAFANLGEFNGLAYVVLFSGIYLNNFVYYYLLMVISQLTATWHWKVEDAKHRGKTIVRSLGSVARYHTGTIAFNSTIILPILVALYTAVTSRITIRPAKCIDALLICYLMVNIPEYALATTAINGQNFIEATKTTYLTLTKDSPLCFSFIFIFRSVMPLMKFIILILSGTPYFFYFILNEYNFFPHALYVVSFYAILFSPVTLVLSAIEKANLLCTIEEDETNETSATDNVLLT